MSQQERLSLLEGLLRLVEAKPRALLDPTTLLMIRLALSGADGSRADEARSRAEAAAEDMRLEVRHAEATAKDATRRLNDMLASLDEALGDKAELEEQVARLEQEVERAGNADSLREELRESKALLATIEGIIDNPDREWGRELPPLAAKIRQALRSLRQVTADAGSATDTVAELEEMVASLRHDNEKLQGAKGADARKMARRITDRLKRYEFAARSQKFSFRGSREKIPCCPSCGGLDADLVDGPQAGHRKGCWFGDLVRELREDIKSNDG